MRIIAGEFRGRTLKAPKGEGTRPTTDRVREAMMSTVHSARGGFDDAVDVYKRQRQKARASGLFNVGLLAGLIGRRTCYARSTLPAFMHFVQTLALRT